MRDAHTFIVSVLVGVLGGCAGPTVTVRHTLPADVPTAQPVSVGAFTFTGPRDLQGAERYEVRLTETLGGLTAAGSNAAEIRGSIRCDVAERAGARELRYWDPATRTLRTETVPTLERNVSVHVVHLVPSEEGAPEARIETHSSYRSAADPRTRGESGLRRGDRPEAIPATGRILEELLAHCSAAFASMVRPRELVADVTLRPAWGTEASAGLAAMEDRDFDAAVRHFEAALTGEGRDPDLTFNLAVAEEASGRIERSLEHYQEVRKARPKDEAVRRGIERARRLLAVRGHAKALRRALQRMSDEQAALR